MNWLCQSLVESPYSYCLCLTEKKFKKALKQIGIKTNLPDFMKTGHANATVHWFDDTDPPACIVCLGDRSKVSTLQVYSLLVHEAVHIWQCIKRHIGEDEPSKEFEAYSIQRISQSLMYEYKEQKR